MAYRPIADGIGCGPAQGPCPVLPPHTDGKLEFIGEDSIDHTPKGETVRLFTGNAFDLVGERIRTAYTLLSAQNTLDESFEIKLRNRKEHEAVEIRVVEHLYRAFSWEIAESSEGYRKNDAKAVEFRVVVPPGEEKAITYTVHYSW